MHGRPVGDRMTDWIVLGAGGHARSVADVVQRKGDRVVAVTGIPSGRWDVPVLVSDDEAIDLALRSDLAVALGIGSGVARLSTLERLRAAGVRAPAVTASTATVSASASIAAGVVVLEHAHVGPAARLGPAVLVNTAAVVEHDVVVGSGTHVAPGAVLLGGACAEDLVFVGAGAVVLPLVRLGEGCVVGAGSVVRDDVGPGRTVVGSPALPTSP